MIVAARKADRALVDQILKRLVAVGEARLAHALRRPNGVQRVIRVGDVEWPMLTAEETGGVERLEFLAFADVESLADVDERWHRGVSRAKRAGDHRADMWGGHGKRRRVAGVPMVLVARVENEAEVAGLGRGVVRLRELAGLVGADQRASIHHVADFFQALGQLNVVNRSIDCRESAEDLVGRQALFVGGVALGIERLGGGHAAAHPEHDDRVGRCLDLFITGLGQDLARVSGGQGAQSCGAGGLEEISTV